MSLFLSLSQRADVAAPASGAHLVEHLFTCLQFFFALFSWIFSFKNFLLTLTGQ